MNEETKQDGDERRIARKTMQIREYTNLEKKIAIEIHEMDTDPVLNKHYKAISEHRGKIKELEEPFRRNIQAAREQQTGIKAELVDEWLSTEDKTFECNAGTATLRTTKSLHIRNKEKLIAFLKLNNKLIEFIKSFEITKLRKIKDAGLLDDEIATYDEKRNIAIKITEVEKDGKS